MNPYLYAPGFLYSLLHSWIHKILLTITLSIIKDFWLNFKVYLYLTRSESLLIVNSHHSHREAQYAWLFSHELSRRGPSVYASYILLASEVRKSVFTCCSLNKV